MLRRILLVEDEESIQEAIKLNLELEGYEVEALSRGKDVLSTLKSERFDLVILDIMLPDIDGIRLCEMIRLENTDVPILFLSAKSSGEDRITGLKKGADDYLTKPFNLEELLLRVQILIRRSKKKESIKDTYRFGKWNFNFNTYEVEGDGQKISLTKKEAQLLKLLLERKNEIISREQILETVWGYDKYPSTRTIDNFIVNFRKYFEEDPKNPRFFQSIRGVGYKMSDEL